MDTQPTTPVFTVTTADELPIEIVVETPSGSRTKIISNLDDPGIKNRFAHIKKVKESLAAEYQPSDPHKCLITYTSKEGDVSVRCSGGEGPFEKYLHEFRQRGGWNLRVIVQYRNGPGSSQQETVQKEVERLLKEKRSENFNKKLCLLETVLLSTLFGDGDIFGRLSAQDPILSQRLKEDLNLANEIRDKGKKLLALMILAKVENLGETFFDFWDENYRDESMPLSLETRPSFCDSNVWEAMRLYEDQLLVAELKSLKEKKCLHDFWEGQLLPLAEKEKIDGGGCAEIYKVRLIDDHPELYGIYVVGKSEFPLVLDHNVLISSPAGRRCREIRHQPTIGDQRTYSATRTHFRGVQTGDRHTCKTEFDERTTHYHPHHRLSSRPTVLLSLSIGGMQLAGSLHQTRAGEKCFPYYMVASTNGWNHSCAEHYTQ